VFSGKPRSAEFEAAALPHLPDLYRAATRLLGDSARAEDVVQDVYLQAWKSFDQFQTGTNCRAWLFKILFYSIQHYRRKWLNLRNIRESEEVLEHAVAPAPPVPGQITDQDLLAALDGVPQEFRAAILLVDVEEFSYKDAAAILNTPIGTVMSRLSRGRRLLRERLATVAATYGIGPQSREGKSA